MNRNTVLTVLAAFFCVALVVSNIIAGKLWQVTSTIILPAAVILFPIVYIIGDIVPEIFGLQKARQVIWLGFTLNLLAVVIFLVTLKLYPPEFWQNQNAFEAVLGFTPRLLFASFIGYLSGTHINAWVFIKIKSLTGERWLWMRTIGSTIFGESADSILFISIAFIGTLDITILPSLIMSQALFKICYEVLATPFTYVIINYIKKRI